MAYVRLTWVDDVTPLNADNMNNIENGIVETRAEIEVDSTTANLYEGLGWEAPTA